MAIPFKLTPAEYAKVKNDPIHYNLSMRFNGRDGFWEGEAETQAQIKQINTIINGEGK